MKQGDRYAFIGPNRVSFGAQEKMKLQNKIAIVTGGSKGIGRAICESFAKEGAVVIVVNKTSPDLGKEVANEINKAGGRAESMICDISKASQVKSLVADIISKYGRIDILINNAGVVIFDKKFEEHSLDDWNHVMDINLKGPFLLSQAVTPFMKGQKYGKIIFVSSIAALVGVSSGIAPYSAAKGGVLAMAKTMVAELAPYQINVNCILPGAVKTTINQHLHNDHNALQFLSDRTPSKDTFMNPTDIAGAAVYLASEDSKAVHGLDLIIDNGWCAI